MRTKRNSGPALRVVDPSFKEREADLAAACVAGDRNAQQALAELVFDTVSSTVSYCMNQRIFAEDMVQDSLMEVIDSMRYFRGECQLTTWSRKIALRVCARRLRKQKRRQALLHFLPTRDHEAPMAAASMSRREMRIHLNALVQRLPVPQQQVMILRYVHDHSIGEISELVDAPIETVRDRLKAAKRKMRKIVAEHPVFCDWVEGEKQ